VEATSRLAPPAVSLLEQWPMFDNAIVRHGFAPYMRDYEVEVVALAAVPNGSRSYQEGRYRFVFTHCVVADVQTSVRDDVWPRSWADVFIDYAAWEAAGCPDGYVWGVNDMAAYPGARYLPESPTAAEWSRRLGRPMHEVRIETNAHNLTLVFHELRVHRTDEGNPDTGHLAPIDPVDLLAPAT
jgi:hypothetical protein